jgi:phosphoglycolate phosphatase-like HAD superfamily hydrolase
MVTTHLPVWTVWDLDGVLCDTAHRERFAITREWEEYHKRHLFDKPHAAEVSMLQAWALADLSHRVCICTGRTEPHRDSTKLWLRVAGVPFHLLLMRPEGDRTPSEMLKAQQVFAHVARAQILAVFEDRDKIVKMWRDEGLTCFQPRTSAY